MAEEKYRIDDDNIVCGKPLSEIDFPNTTIRLPTIYWEPQEDITSFELAQSQGILLMMGSIDLYSIENKILKSDYSVQRHFRIEG